RQQIQKLEKQLRAVSAMQPVPKWGQFTQTPSKLSPLGAPLVAVAAVSIVLAAVGVVLFWQTPDGVVRFEINDDDIKVVIDKDGPKITGADKVPITLKPGKHGLTITRGDFTFDTTNF